MQPQIRTLLALFLACAATRSAPAQCRIPTGQHGPGAIDGGRAIVVGGGSAGVPHVRFFSKTAQGWEPGETHAIGNMQVLYPLFVAIDGDRAIAGSPESDSLVGQEFLSGRAIIFDRVGDQWLPTELVSATNGENDFFGAEVELSGDVAVVGALHSGGGYGDGLARAHVFEFDGASWNEVAQLPGHFTDIDVEGDTIVIGDETAPPGRVRVYERVAGFWTWTEEIAVATPQDGPRLGASVALQGDMLAVGAAWPFSSPTAHYVKVFHRQADGVWQEVQHVVPSDSSRGDQFGRGVALSGPTLLVGAPGFRNSAGVVYRFEHDGASFVEAGRFGFDEPVFGFGEYVAFQREDAILSSWSVGSFFRLGFARQASFCPTTPNSTGAHGLLTVEGCDSLDGQRLTLVASNLPSGALGRFFFGTSTTQTPYGDGFRCVGAPLYRLPAGATDATGHLVHDVNFSGGPASHITAGQTWHFQLYHRDAASSGAHLNLTNALSIGITP